MEVEAMTWSEMFIIGISLLFSWGIGIAMIQFPGGVSANLLRKTAQLALWLAENCEWCYLTWTHTQVWTPAGKITYYEMLQHEAQDPEKAIRTFAPWTIPLARFVALIWLGGMIWVTVGFLGILIQGG